MPEDVLDLVIVGSGPAGYTAAIYAARADLHPVLVAGSVTSGGALMNTTEVENFPGFPEGLQGPDLMERMQEQAERFGTTVVWDDAVELQLEGDVKVVRTGLGQVLRARTVVLATGSAYREIGLENEKRLSGHGVSWCATCDAAFFRDKDVAVIGGGDSALEEATFLTRFASTVTVVHRREQLRASKIMQRRAESDPKIHFEWSSHVDDVLGDDRVSGLRLRDAATGEQRTLDVTGMFVAIGHDPRTDLFRDQVELDAGGYVKVDGRSSRTNLPGVFACGDVVDHEYRQAITAAASGTVAALDAERYLAALDDVDSPRVAAVEAVEVAAATATS